LSILYRTEQRRVGPPSLLLSTIALFALCGGLVSGRAVVADTSINTAFASPTPGATPSPNLAPQALGELGSLIAAGKLDDLRWPNFSDFQAEIVKFYGLGANALTWVHDGQATAQAQAMIRLFKQASLEGLTPEDYDASRWDARLAKLGPLNPHPADTDLARFDLAVTVCAARLLAALRVGRVDPQHFQFGFDVGPKRYGLAEFLRTQVIESPDVASVAASLEPHYQGYRRAKVALATYLKLAAQGDGAPLPVPAKSVHPGDTYSGVAPLISRLSQLGDLPAEAAAPADTAIYQGSTVEGVTHFQKRNGLAPDGVLGKETVAELNVPLSQRVKQLQFALERYRWIPSDFPQPPIVVNLPQFKLRTMRRQPAPFLAMRVIVGKAYGHQTPIFADYMRYLIFRPYWEVPMSIQFAELIPKIRRDPGYLTDHGFEVTTRSGTVVTDGVVSDDILGQLRSGSLTIRQKPGPKNALGLVKFIFPNHYNVYLHSTPEPELFLKARRDFSHGCIRVQNPTGLAAWVLRDRPEWTEDKIRAAMNGDQTIQVNLAKPIPVLIIYTTAVVEPDGEVRFFRDIYNQDPDLDRALNHGYPFPS
jgi:murein L,D-transpeptidase YcbB/YkuD